MGTSSSIAVVHSDNSISQIYCHYDGYLEHVGKILLENYNTQELVEELISGGNLSVLGPNIKPKTDTHSFETPEAGVCIYYNRDRGEIGNDTLNFKDIKNFLKIGLLEEYNYIFKDGEWLVSFDDRQMLIKLTNEFIDFY